MQLNAGSNDNRVIGGKIEWNGGYNVFAYQSGNLSFVGIALDRSTDAGFYLEEVTNVVITGCPIRRSCAGEVAGRNCHYYVKNCTNLTISSNPTNSADISDGAPSGIIAPDYVVVDAGGNANCVLTNNSGNGDVAFITRTVTSGDGLRLIDNPSYSNRATYGGNSATLTASGGTANFTVKTLPVGTFSRQNRKLFFTVRDTNGTTLSGEQQIVVARESGTASVVVGAITSGAGPAAYASFFTHAYAIDATTGIITLTITNNRIYDATVTVDYF